jgi:hypothetical protein
MRDRSGPESSRELVGTSKKFIFSEGIRGLGFRGNFKKSPDQLPTSVTAAGRAYTLVYCERVGNDLSSESVTASLGSVPAQAK